ncbi:MAG TPA: hypothetical protein PK970_13410 [Hyphomicrobiaceae bacterium]|nr:hypothetical protein [Hyphomicrobiaceae bacterium]
MSRFSFKTTASLLATAFVAGITLAAVSADAKPFGGGFGGGGGFKPGIGGGFKPIGPIGGFKPPVLKPGPIAGLPGKIKLPPGGLKPIDPCKFKFCGPVGPKPKPPHAGGHKHWVWGGITILAADYAGCGYEFYKWKSTGSTYWRHRYFDCRGFY